jgi:diacylglycerol kinase (ATP)
MISPRDLPPFKWYIRWVVSANHAIEGILHATRTQRHIRFHLFSAFAILLLCFFIGLRQLEFALIALLIMLVILAEMFNSALEAAVDLASPEASELARIAKDMAAGAVLICVLAAVVVGYIILAPYLRGMLHGVWRLPHHTADHIALLALIITMMITVIIKGYFGSGTPLRGGFPSGHAAVVFSLWFSLIHLTASLALMGGALAVALTVAAQRIRVRVHSLRDVVFGALLGASVTQALFWIFY